MRHQIRSGLLAGALAFAVAPTPAATDARVPRCVARRLAAHRLVMIVALGSSSTAGAGASSAEATYPSRLMAELARRFPTQSIIVLNRGISGERAVDMLARFDDSVAAERPDLVLWQLGTNSVLRDHEIGGNGGLLEGELALLKLTGADVVLINPQYAPKVLAHPAVATMVELISATAKAAE